MKISSTTPNLTDFEKTAKSGKKELYDQDDREKIKELSQQFESMFHDILLKSMRSTVQKSGFIDGGNAEDIYRGMLDSEYSKLMSTQGNTGLAESIEAQLLETMGGNRNIADKQKLIEGQKVYSGGGLQIDAKKATIVSSKI